MAVDEQDRPRSTGKNNGLTDSEYLRYIADQDFTTIEEELIFRLEWHINHEPEFPDTQSAEVRQEVLDNMDLSDLIAYINSKRTG